MINIWEAYQYLFYKCSRWDRYSWKNKDMSGACQTGLYVLSFLLWGNFLTFSVMSEIFTGYGFSQIEGLSKLNIILIAGIFLFLNYLILARNKRYEKIFKHFENEGRKSKIIGNIFIWSYIIITFVAGGVSGVMLGHFRQTESSGRINIQISNNQSLQNINPSIVKSVDENKQSSDNDKLVLPVSKH